MFTRNGTDYIIYHAHNEPPGGSRTIAIDQVTYNSNGTLNDVVPTHDGVPGFGWRFTNNLAEGKPATASSVEDGLARYAASRATDDSSNTRWSGDGLFVDEWLQVDLGSVKTIGRTQVAFEQVPDWTKYKIEYSTNGTTWSTFADRTTVTTGFGIVTDTHAPVSARYVKITIVDQEDIWSTMSIWEFKVFAS